MNELKKHYAEDPSMHEHSPDCRGSGCVGYYRADEVDIEIERLEARDVVQQVLLQLARGALADIANSTDMTLELARAKANRVYEETDGGLK